MSQSRFIRLSHIGYRLSPYFHRLLNHQVAQSRSITPYILILIIIILRQFIVYANPDQAYANPTRIICQSSLHSVEGRRSWYGDYGDPFTVVMYITPYVVDSAYIA